MSSPPRSSARGRVPFPVHDDPTTAPVAVPAGHFLAPANAPRRADDWAAGARPDTSTVAAADYDVSVVSGFLPPEEPVQSLVGVPGGWDLLEACLAAVRREVLDKHGEAVGRVSDAWAQSVLDLPSPSPATLTSVPLLRRAHLVLAFISHFYIHSSFPAKASVPAPLAVPWVAISERLGIPPILTYADTVLWNWHLVDRSLGLRADNVAITTTFTSSPSESAFFLLSLLSELYAPSLLRLMSTTLDEAFFADALALTRIVDHLTRIAGYIEELRVLLVTATAGPFGHPQTEIVPREFYWLIRPWFNGGKWTYHGVGPAGEDVDMQWGGPSAGQSSLVHAIDLFLEVDHSPRPSASPEAASSSSSSSSSSLSGRATTPAAPPIVHSSSSASMSPMAPLPPAPSATRAFAKAHPAPTDATFMVRMASYMPGPHRAFLAHLASLSSTHPFPSPLAPPSVRALAKTHGGAVGDAYNAAVRSMKAFRDSHLNLVARFIIAPARSEPARESVFWPAWDADRREKAKTVALRGTGGTELVTFLKTCRTRTVEAVLE